MTNQAADPAPTDPQVIDAAHLAHQREWSRATFGPGARTHGVIDHIRKELNEIEADSDDVTEWVDVVILALDGAWRAGYEPQEIIDAIKAKQAKNEARTWPDWRTASQDTAIEHDRAADPAPTDPCARCGHTSLRHKIGRCSMCSQSCPGFVAADPAPTDHVRRARRRSVGVVTPRMIATDPAPTDEGDRGLIDYAHEWLLEQEVATEHGDLIRDLTAALEAWQDRAADPAPTDDDTQPISTRLFGDQP